MQVKGSGVRGQIRELLSIGVNGTWQPALSATLRTGMIFLRHGVMIGSGISEIAKERQACFLAPFADRVYSASW